MRFRLAVLIVMALQAGAAAAQPGVRPGAGSAAVPQTTADGTSSSASARQTPPPTDVQLPVSLDKIRKALEKPPADDEPAIRIGELPTFRVTVYGPKKMTLPDFEESLKQVWQPVVRGGIHNKEVMDLITPPQARPYGAFVDTDLVQVAASSLVNALLGRALIKGYHAVKGEIRDWQEQRIREEVAAELAAFLLANPQPPPQTGPGQKKVGGPEK